jgi:uncharacterized repeat protein (TIGR03806 family)
MALFALITAAHGQILPRVQNSTLQLPLIPPARGYDSEAAFPGLTFTFPVAIVAPPNETNRLFIVEKWGRIQVVTNLAEPNITTFLDIRERVNPTNEGGLLGLAFHPGFATNYQFFVFYTLDIATDAGTGFHDRIARFEVDAANPNRALPDSEVPLITQFDQAANHNAGDLHFGPDGYLYASLGDEGGGGDEYGNSRSIDRDFFCAVLRLDVDRRPGSLNPNPHPAVDGNYAIPPDNPFIGATEFNGRPINPNNVRTEFWAVGFRNPWRFSFDPATGLLYCGDVGQTLWEEINVIQKGGNYGWNYLEGTRAFSGSAPADTVLLPPILEYQHSGNASFGGSSVTGGVVYRGDRLSQLFGDYVFGDYGSGNIWALTFDGTTATNWRKLTSGEGVVAFGTDPFNGDLLFAEIGTGRIRRLIYHEDLTGTPIPTHLSGTGAFSDLASLTPEPGIVPYEINAPFWSDDATKTRWFSVPDASQFLTFNSEAPWQSPSGTVWIKHFELELTKDVPESARRLETRFLVRNEQGVHGFTYRWNEDQTDATLVPEEGLDESIAVDVGGSPQIQTWRYPSRSECLACHTSAGGLALGFDTFQLNRSRQFGDVVTNQILGLAEMGYFSEPIADVTTLQKHVQIQDPSATVQDRVRSYLAVNCAQCHQPEGSARGLWDARFTTTLADAGIINGPLIDSRGDPNQRVLTPGATETSMLLTRISQPGPGHMPPLATDKLNQPAIDLLSQWIQAGIAPEFRSLRYLSDGVVTYGFVGLPNHTYRVEFSTNFINWSVLTEIVTDANGAAQGIDFEPPDSRVHRSYRIRLP